MNHVYIPDTVLGALPILAYLIFTNTPEGNISFAILEIRKLRNREPEELPQCLTAEKRQSQTSKPGPFTPSLASFYSGTWSLGGITIQLKKIKHIYEYPY